MALSEVTYAFDNGQVFAYENGRIVASGPDVDRVKKETEKILRNETEAEEAKKEKAKKASATHIETPNGVKGKIVSRHSSWDSDETVSVRFDNGRIVSIATSTLAPEAFVTEQHKTAGSETPVTNLRSRLSANYEHDRDSLQERSQVLQALKAEASQILAEGTSYTDEAELDEIVVLADAEQREISEAIEHLDSADAEIFAPPESQVVEQAQVGTNGIGGTFLDQTVQDMITEAEEQDFEKLLDEGPVEFVAELPDAALADTGVTTSAARDFITSKTAGVQTTSAQIDKFQGVFLERVEAARRSELADRKKLHRHEASTSEPTAVEGPDEGLFL